MPVAVVDELNRRGPDDPAVRAIHGAAWLQVLPCPSVPAEIQAWDLGRGESAALALASARPGSEVILDDLAARALAKTLGLPVQGTLGLLTIAKQVGLITAVRPVLEQLRQAGMYVSDRLANQVLTLLNE